MFSSLTILHHNDYSDSWILDTIRLRNTQKNSAAGPRFSAHVLDLTPSQSCLFHYIIWNFGSLSSKQSDCELVSPTPKIYAPRDAKSTRMTRKKPRIPRGGTRVWVAACCPRRDTNRADLSAERWVLRPDNSYEVSLLPKRILERSTSENFKTDRHPRLTVLPHLLSLKLREQ